ncbi:MAG: hypothetical protein HY319_32190 [Armatimonadetes bacterium]|nr:hypothetical protein [Armatimonadota bacterium]
MNLRYHALALAFFLTTWPVQAQTTCGPDPAVEAARPAPNSPAHSNARTAPTMPQPVLFYDPGWWPEDRAEAMADDRQISAKLERAEKAARQAHQGLEDANQELRAAETRLGQARRAQEAAEQAADDAARRAREARERVSQLQDKLDQAGRKMSHLDTARKNMGELASQWEREDGYASDRVNQAREHRDQAIQELNETQKEYRQLQQELEQARREAAEAAAEAQRKTDQAAQAAEAARTAEKQQARAAASQQAAQEAANRAQQELEAAREQARLAQEEARRQAEKRGLEAARPQSADHVGSHEQAPTPETREDAELRERAAAFSEFLEHLEANGEHESADALLKALHRGLTITGRAFAAAMKAWATGKPVAPGLIKSGATSAITTGYAILVKYAGQRVQQAGIRLLGRREGEIASELLGNRKTLVVRGPGQQMRVYLRNPDGTVTVLAYSQSQGVRVGTF